MLAFPVAENHQGWFAANLAELSNEIARVVLKHINYS